MQKITKGDEAPELSRWRRRHPGMHYNDIGVEDGDVRRSIRRDCLKEQNGLCAFCCSPVSIDNGHNAHIRSKTLYPRNSLDWDNIVASCMAEEHCGMYQKRNDIPLTPLMPECELELKFYVSGKVHATTERAQRTIDVLNLNSADLCRKRKKALEDLVYSLGFYPVEDISTWDSELIQGFIEECNKVINDDLTPYAPVLVNIVRQFL